LKTTQKKEEKRKDRKESGKENIIYSQVLRISLYGN
jgi:hypothetical protein